MKVINTYLVTEVVKHRFHPWVVTEISENVNRLIYETTDGYYIQRGDLVKISESEFLKLINNKDGDSEN